MASTDKTVLAKLYENPEAGGCSCGSGGTQSPKVTKRDRSGMSDSDPNTYKKTEVLNYNTDVEDIHKRWDSLGECCE